MKKIIITLTALLFTVTVFAQTDHVQLQLLSVKADKVQEKNGDEIYMTLTEYPSKGRPVHKRIPEHPLHWVSKHLDKIDRLELWKKDLKDGESSTIIISLIEEDVPPWNTDDLIGTVRLQLKNKDGKIESSWSIPNSTEAPLTINTKYGEAQFFSLVGADTKYDVYFLLK